MKYVLILGDGMAGLPIDSLDNKTTLAYAKTPVMDSLAPLSEIGLCQTVPNGLKPGSDVANLSCLGYNPADYYTGRSPLEALSIGVHLRPDDVAFRCNIVALSEEVGGFYSQSILDHSSGEIDTADANILLADVCKELNIPFIEDAATAGEYPIALYSGTSYRHCLVINGGSVMDLSQPHDILGQKIKNYLPSDERFLSYMEKSYEILKDHPLNIARKENGKNPANCMWFWGAGVTPALPQFFERTGKTGVMISAVDLLKGIGKATGMEVKLVDGANGGLDTNYAGKVKAAMDALLKEGKDFAYIHVEAPDEMGHQGSISKKITAIERLDALVIAPILKALKDSGEAFRLLIMPDHLTPVSIRTHTADAVPFMLYDSGKEIKKHALYNEKTAKSGGVFIESGVALSKIFLG